MGLASSEKELSERAVLFIKAELKRAKLTYADLAEKLKEHGLQETSASISNKLARGTISAAFLLATLAALGMEGVTLADL